MQVTGGALVNSLRGRMCMANFEENKQKLIAEVETLCNDICQKEMRVESMQKELNDVQWKLSEEQRRREQCEHDSQDKGVYIARLEAELQEMKKHFEESQYFLYEEKSRNSELMNSLQGSSSRIQELENHSSYLNSQCESLRKDLADAQWFLGEERAKNQALSQR